jgi:alpha-L-fucosidase
MYQTILPFASKYRLPVNADFHEDELAEMAEDIRKLHGVVLVVWEHSGLPDIARKLGVKEELRWKDSDYDSLWIVRWVNGQAVLTRDQEGLHPSTSCQ